jgi:hypothetical protein
MLGLECVEIELACHAVCFLLQPVLRFSADDVSDVTEFAGASSTGAIANNLNPAEWSAALKTFPARSLHGRRILTYALASALQEASASRKTRHTMSNLLALTALLDRELTARWPSGTKTSRRPPTASGSATPGPPVATEGVGSLKIRSSSSLGLSLLALGKDTVMRAMTPMSTRRPSTVEAVSALAPSSTEVTDQRTDGLEEHSDLEEGRPDAVGTDSQLNTAGSERSSVENADAQHSNHPHSASENVEASAVEPDPSQRLDGTLARLVLIAWDDLLVPSPEDAERYLAMTAEAFPLSGTLLQVRLVPSLLFKLPSLYVCILSCVTTLWPPLL